MVTLSNIQESWTNSSWTSHTRSTEGLCYFSGSITELPICSHLIPFIKLSFYRCIYLKISGIKVDKKPFIAVPVSIHITDTCLWPFILFSVKCTHVSGIHDPRLLPYGSWWRHHVNLLQVQSSPVVSSAVELPTDSCLRQQLSDVFHGRINFAFSQTLYKRKRSMFTFVSGFF